MLLALAIGSISRWPVGLSSSSSSSSSSSTHSSSRSISNASKISKFGEPTRILRSRVMLHRPTNRISRREHSAVQMIGAFSRRSRSISKINVWSVGFPIRVMRISMTVSLYVSLTFSIDKRWSWSVTARKILLICSLSAILISVKVRRRRKDSIWNLSRNSFTNPTLSWPSDKVNETTCSGRITEHTRWKYDMGTDRNCRWYWS